MEDDVKDDAAPTADAEAGTADAATKEGEPKKKFERPPKLPKTPEDLAAIALLDRLRFGVGETAPTGLPLACVVKVVDSMDIPKAHELYALVTVEGRDGKTWKACVRRNCLKVGARALFVSENAALPMGDDRFVNPDVGTLREKVYRFGFGTKERRRILHVKRGIYRHNCGYVYPIDGFTELQRLKVGDVCAVRLHIDSAEELHQLAMAPRPKKNRVLVIAPKPPPKPPAKDDALAKERLRLKRLVMRGVIGG